MLFGMWAPGFHVLSLLAHLAGVSMLYVLLRNFFPIVPCLAAATFYGVDNGHFRSLYWISAIPEPVALVFFLAAFHFFIRFDCSGKTWQYGVSLASMGLCVMSKESILGNRPPGQIRQLHSTGELQSYHAFFYVRGALFNGTEEFRADPESFLKAQESLNTRAPAAWLVIQPDELTIGIDTLTLRVLNLDAPASDLLYSIDGELMPLLTDWQLEKDQSARAETDRTMRPGTYQFRAFRDSTKKSVLAWIPTYAAIQVR